MVEALVRRDKTPWRLMLQLLGTVAAALAALHDADALNLQARLKPLWSTWLRLELCSAMQAGGLVPCICTCMLLSACALANYAYL